MSGQNGLACLVVDDEPRLRRVLVQLLESDGFEVREAGTGVEALQVMETHPAPLVISDLRMPQMDGANLLRHIVQRWPDTAVVMVSAVADVDMAVKCLHLGAFDYVSKPFNLEEVRARVEQAMQRRQLKLELNAYREGLEVRVRAQERQIEGLFLGGVQALAQAMEAKDAYLRGHSLRVSEYAVGIGRQVGLDAKSIEAISLGAHLHDIGKIGVSEEVLHKKGGLTDAEYRHIMEHPVIGAKILGPLLSDAPLVIDIVRSHHERMDGKGLPDGVKAESLPFVVRIVSVADAFDAMTSERPYRHSLTVERALDELRRQGGVQWDPAAVDGFLKAFPDVHRLPLATPESSVPTSPPAG
ncbi:MAG TPA: HD domain-containing phosphohydrolase [Gemmatimonadales bacterium]|jgi:response regulator RpfG family c-di-GMP phosphodiesterase|nr:HD domain-containing phosphohydrolase [Gemmatimonadales bacterium]